MDAFFTTSYLKPTTVNVMLQATTQAFVLVPLADSDDINFVLDSKPKSFHRNRCCTKAKNSNRSAHTAANVLLVCNVFKTF